jgi:hypothetical protein
MTDGEKMDGVFITRESKTRELSFPSQIEIGLDWPCFPWLHLHPPPQISFPCAHREKNGRLQVHDVTRRGRPFTRIMMGDD